MRKGIRMIGGKEFLLCGRVFTKAVAMLEKKSLLDSWEAVRIVKVSNWDYMLYVHGSRS